MIINRNICFIEGIIDNIIPTLEDNSTENDYLDFRLLYNSNIVKASNLYIDLKIDVFSKKIDYMKEKNVIEEGKYFPFNEHVVKTQNVINNNPVIYKNNIGNNNSEDFDDLFTIPFEDRENFNTDVSISSYRFYVNAYATQKLSQSISILGTLEELNGQRLTETNYRGITAYFSLQDSRNRSVVIKDHYDPNVLLSEGFLDEEIENNTNNNVGLIKRKFKYENVSINGMLYTVLVSDGNTYSFAPKLTSKVLYYNEENNNIRPFNDSISEDDLNGNIVVASRGTDSDNSTNTTSTLGFSGEID